MTLNFLIEYFFNGVFLKKISLKLQFFPTINFEFIFFDYSILKIIEFLFSLTKIYFSTQFKNSNISTTNLKNKIMPNFENLLIVHNVIVQYFDCEFLILLPF